MPAPRKTATKPVAKKRDSGASATYERDLEAPKEKRAYVRRVPVPAKAGVPVSTLQTTFDALSALLQALDVSAAVIDFPIAGVKVTATYTSGEFHIKGF